MNSYFDLINQTFYFPTEEFKVKDGELYFHDIRLMDLVEKYNSPMKLSYLPKISSQIKNAKKWFSSAIERQNYKGRYEYAYCTKSSHFSFVLEEALNNDIHIETSSAYDISIVKKLYESEQIDKSTYIICNGFKRPHYIAKIAEIINEDYNCVPILDHMSELDEYVRLTDKNFKIGIRVASDEEPNFGFYTSRLGIRYTDILNFYTDKIKTNPRLNLKMLHFFINTGIKDTAYYWDELSRFVEMYCQLKKICPELDSIDIGGGFPIKTSLGFEFDYQYMADEIIRNIKEICIKHGVDDPHIFTEFGNFTVGESGAVIYSILDQKLQNDKELWYMIDSSFMTTLPDSWALNQRFILLPLNQWDSEYHAVNLGGLSCDSMDYYNSEMHSTQVFLPKLKKDERLYIGMFHTGAYQESLGGFGGIQHCLIPAPKHVILKNRHENCLFSEEQSDEKMLDILGYNGKK